MYRGLVLAVAFLSWPLPGHSDVSLLQQALALFNAGKYQECFEIISPYVQQNPNSGAGHKLLGMDEYMLGHSQNALTEVQRATELDPKDADAFYYLGRLYFSTDNAPGALKAFEKAIELDPSSVRARNHLGQTYEALGRERDAEQAYLQAIALARNQPKESEWPYYNLAALYVNTGRVDESISYFREALKHNPQFCEAKVKLAVVLSKQDRTGEALNLLQEAIETEPRNPEAHYRLALLLMKSGKRQEADQHFALFEKYRKP